MKEFENTSNLTDYVKYNFTNRFKGVSFEGGFYEFFESFFKNKIRSAYNNTIIAILESFINFSKIYFIRKFVAGLLITNESYTIFTLLLDLEMQMLIKTNFLNMKN
jgi:hypothetical protein